MATHKRGKSPKKGMHKTFSDKRTINPSQGVHGSKAASDRGAPFQQEDVARRLGDYEGTGEHARTGNRGHQ